MDNFAKADRRTFMRRGALGAGALWMGSLQELAARSEPRRGPVVVNGLSPYGPISPKRDQTTGLELLKLPDGFRYWSYSWTGDVMSDGVACPRLHDGMAVVDEWHSRDDRDDDGRRGRRRSTESGGKDDEKDDEQDDDRRRRSGRIVLIRNHEGDVGAPYLTNNPRITYAPQGVRTGSGGTTNLIFDTRRGRVAGVLVESCGDGSQLCRRCDAVGDMGHLRGNRGARARLELRSRSAREPGRRRSRRWAGSRTRR